jgi:hypothetical protein
VRLVLGLSVVLVVAVPGTTAAWVDPVPVTGATITAGTVDLKVQNGDSVTGYTAMNLATMEPGDSSAGVLTVKNAGTAPLRYYVDASVTNADSKGLGSSLVAKVTADATTSGSTCAGTALSGTGTTFGANLVGSAASPRVLAGGASENLCVQARLPDGGTAQGAATSISFTFNASTGSAATPGWTDSVPVSGTTIGTATAFYLGTNASGNTTSSSLLPLRTTGPTLTTLFNYDTDRDTTAGLLLKSTGAMPARQQQWYLPIGATPLTLSGTSSLRIWSAVRAFNPTAVGSLAVTLFDCDGTGATCNQLATNTFTSTGAWSGGSNTWVSRTIPITTAPGSYTWAAGRSLKVEVATGAGAVDDMLIAYDTTTYKAAILIQ